MSACRCSTQKRIQQLSRERLPVLGEDGYILFFSPAPGRPKPDPASADTRYPWEFFGFYDLAGDKDGRSEANLRFINDINFNSISYYNEARYSWSDRTNGADYRLSGVGLQPFHQVTAYPFYPAAHVPWAEAQNWFVTREWMAGNFAEDEGGRHSATIGEGLPPNGEWESAERRRVLFRERERFVPPYLPIELGVREENSLNWNQKPSLYLSAIDRRVHMTAAESGIIVYEAETVNNTIGQGYGGADFTLPELATGKARTHSKVEYQDIDHDGRVDHWTWFKEDKPAAILYSGNGKLVYADADGLRIKTLPADFATAVDLGAPPTNPQEWNKFHETLAPNYQRERLDNLRGLFDAAPGEVQEIPHMGLTEVRPRPNGLSLLVTLGADTPLPDWVERDTATDAEESGSFLLRYDGRYRLNSLTPAQLAAPNGLEITNTAPFQADRVEVRLRLRNTGDTPVRNANITLFSRTPGGLKPLAGQIANLQGEDETTVTLFWVPDAPGLQDLVAIDISSKGRVPLAAASVTVQARRSPNPLELLALSTETPAPILAGAALLASTLALAVFLRVSTEEGKDGG
ncbi:MAG: hypothetical protein NTZ05_21695 [Chloroflexi bacterium]|nr:hypothetical protein [Chloroflexota bacterium]